LGIAGIIAVAGLPDRKYVHTGLQEIFKKITRLTREGVISEENYKRLIKIKREVNFFGEVSLETTKVLDELLQENHLTKEEVDTLANLIPDSERVNK
jgi:predicted CopG family antitoxin